ncbi:hypothetical protein FXO38_13661 [Capsicum annuum]|nr:hypothetical protein FXO38_13661 [Capsicum annuum]KAF3662690.1 hypothetical protein FXO37_12335 [Capsicum annuum]
MDKHSKTPSTGSRKVLALKVKERSKSSPPPIPSSFSFDITIHLTKIDLKLDSINDLLLATHFYLDKTKDARKEINIDIARLRLRLDQVIKEATKIESKIHSTSDLLFSVITNQFTNPKDTTA